MDTTEKTISFARLQDDVRAAFFADTSKNALIGDIPNMEEGVVIVDGEEVQVHIPDSEGDLQSYGFVFASPGAARIVAAQMVDVPSVVRWLEEL